MKNKYFLMSCSILLLSACSQTDDLETSSSLESMEPLVATTVSLPEPESTFGDGILETDSFRLSIEKAEVIYSLMEEEPGLYVTFSLENKSSDQEVIPIETLDWIQLEQKNDTSRIALNENYHYLDAFGDDLYNEMVDKSNATSNALLPEKTIEFVNGYTLDNESHSVEVVGVSPLTGETLGKYTIDLSEISKVDKPQEPIEEVIEEPVVYEEPTVEEWYSEVSQEEVSPEFNADNFQTATDYLSGYGFFLGGADSFLYSNPITSGLSQALWFATESNDEDGYLSDTIYPIFEEASLYVEGTEIWLHSIDNELILIASDGEIIYSIVN